VNRLRDGPKPDHADAHRGVFVDPHAGANVCTTSHTVSSGLSCKRWRSVCPRQRVCGNPRSIDEVAGSGQRDVTTFDRVKKSIPSGP